MKQRGFVTVAVLVAVLVIAGSAGAYHWITVSGLKSTIEEREKEITKLKGEVASLTLRNLALENANKEFKTLAEAQNKALADIKKERDFALTKWEEAKKDAASTKVVSESRIKKIMSTTVASAKDACAAWEKLITEYVADRRKAMASP